MQLGLISREEALASGLSRHALRRRLQSGKWQELFCGIYLPSPQAPTLKQQLFAGSRWAGGVASHQSAAALFGLLNCDVIELTTTRYVRSPRQDVIVHRVRSLDRGDLTRIGNIPVTRPVRTLFDIAGVVDADTLRSVVYGAWQRELITAERLEKALGRSASGKPGIAELRRIVEQGLDSYLERMLRRLLDKSPLRDYRQEFEVITPQGEQFFIDFAYPDERVAVETDGWATHSDRVAFQRDRYKWRELAKLDWLVLPLTHDDIKFAPNDTLTTISVARAARRSA